MVTAGVFLLFVVVRFWSLSLPFFGRVLCLKASPFALMVATTFGALTAFFAATVGAVQGIKNFTFPSGRVWVYFRFAWPYLAQAIGSHFSLRSLLC